MGIVISSLQASVAKDLLLTLGKEIPSPRGKSAPCHLSLFTLKVNVGWTMGRSHYHVKVCKVKVGISRNVGVDWNLTGSFCFLRFVCLLCCDSVTVLSLGENTQEDSGQLSTRQCNHR